MLNHGKYIALLLRHRPERENLNMDEYGYVSVDQLLKKLNISKDILDNIVKTNNKKRFSYNEDQTKIRANQGHSINVIIDFEKVNNPPTFLYHGTSIKNKESILKNGLLKMNRQHVHLTDNKDTAKNVGMRYAKLLCNLVIFKIDTESFVKDGNELFKSKNGVYLTDHVPSKYIK